jgi:acyl carrier protein
MENNNPFNKVRNFTIVQNGLSESEIITEDTSIQDDLGVYGDDAVEFILAFGKEFNVNVENFQISDYFDGEGFKLFSILTDKIFGSIKKKEFLVKHLIKATLTGRLDEQTFL